MNISPQSAARIAVAGVFVALAAFLYFFAHLPLWGCLLIALGSVVLNSFVLAVEDGEFSKQKDPKP